MTRIVIKPNASLSKKGAVWLVSSLSFVMLLISAVFAWLGLWLVAPFAGLEIILLVVIFRYLLKNSRRKQVIEIDAEDVRIEEGIDSPECASSFKRRWVQVVLEPPKIRGYPTRLFLRSAGKQVRVGEVLDDDERQQLAQQLKRLVVNEPDQASS